MKLIDLYYRAFKAFKTETKNDKASHKLHGLIVHASEKSEFFRTTKFDCKIEEDWIKNIEEGLEFVEKAIMEERQFIRTHGEVVPIGKVKKVTRSSVEHLSRHSDFITRVPKTKADNLIPDKLYIVEKLSDYLVYENRFIYMLLSYLKDFIQMRLDNIKEKTTTYHSQMFIDRKIELSQRHIKYHLKFNEKLENDPFLIKQYNEIPLVNRVENLYATVVSFLATPLMKEISKAPMIKPPVVKTNVLRMNPNFRMALRLYEYVMAYNKDGYVLEEVQKIHQPLPSELGDGIAETIELNSVLTYIETENRKDFFEKRYQESKRIQKISKDKEFQEGLRILKKRIVEMHEDPTEYIFRIEKRNVELEQDSINYTLEKEKNKELVTIIDDLRNEYKLLEEQIIQMSSEILSKDNEIDQLNQKYFDDMTLAENIHQQEIIQIKQFYEDKIVKLIEEHEIKLQQTIESYEARLKQTIEKYEVEIKYLTESYEAQLQETIAIYEAEIKYLTESYEDKLEETIKTYKTEINQLTESYENNLKQFNESHKIELHHLIETHEEKLEQTIEAHKSKLQQVIESYEFEKKELITIHDLEKESYESKTNSLKETTNELNLKIKNLVFEYNQSVEENSNNANLLNSQIMQLNDEKKYANAQYIALKTQQGLITDESEFTSKEKFKQLELEMIAYKKLFKDQWKKTKARIREKAKSDVFDDKVDNKKEGNDFEH